MSLQTLLAVDPAESPHWLFPELPEIIYGGIASVLSLIHI